ncbi:uncharacterized protein LOC115634160 [Scaptodrosophila lebanonensis]|uniref:Uncharacterized protein LOC115634160 n=1 Tax=Drosophila lebanonensis TaxID=7225 RepID=A0A6J2UJC4_DROLE|nr:uncharacterized protein LOC115634160 [Scaptodrosophila lebanonensis]
MGCSNSKSTPVVDESKVPAKSNKMEAMNSSKQEYPASEAFTIPLDNDDDKAVAPQLNETLREPPKRIQELMRQAASTEPLTLDELEEKQQRAEQRRQELMQQKLETIQKNTQMLMRGHERDASREGMDKEEEEEMRPSPPQ